MMYGLRPNEAACGNDFGCCNKFPELIFCRAAVFLRQPEEILQPFGYRGKMKGDPFAKESFFIIGKDHHCLSAGAADVPGAGPALFSMRNAEFGMRNLEVS